MVTLLAPELHRAVGRARGKSRSAGLPIPDLQLRVVDAQDPEGHECAVGEVGEVIVKSPAVMLFYWGRPEETARALHRAPHDGWMHTGDAGRVDALAEDLRVFCKTLIAGYKCPKSVEFVAALPLSAAGKVLKNRLREPCWAGRERCIA